MRLIHAALRFCSNDCGVGSIYMLLLLPVFLMLLGLGMDGVAAFRTREMLQSTADATAIGAALQLPTVGAANTTQTNAAVAAAFTYSTKNMSVAGFGHVLNTSAGTNGDIVFGNWDGTNFNTPAPAGSAENAIQVTVKTAAANSNPYPTSFLALIGKGSWDITATAISAIGKSEPLCVLILSTMDKGSGLSKVDLNGCSIASNGDLTCNGHNMNADFGLAHGTNGGSAGCGNRQYSGVPITPDPYASLASNIPATELSSCGGKFLGTSWSADQSLTSTPTLVCGDLSLTKDVTINTPSGGSVIYVENGQLNTNGHVFQTANGSALTIVFSGDTSGSNIHNISSSGTVQINAPTTGNWAGIAVYQDPSLTDKNGGLDMNYGGNSPTWNITGVTYLPNATVSMSGAVNKNPSGSACVILVAGTLSMNGAVQIPHGGCKLAGITQPSGLAPLSVLVQ